MMIIRQICNKATPWYRLSLMSLSMFVALALSIGLGAVEISCAEESADEAVSIREMGLFLSISDAMTFHDKIVATQYYLFEPGNNANDGAPSSAIFPHARTMNDFQWLFNRFNRKSTGLIILPVLDSGVHISYKLDF